MNEYELIISCVRKKIIKETTMKAQKTAETYLQIFNFKFR